MTHEDHVKLIRKGITKKGGKWADLGSGAGAFTLAVRERIGEEGEIFSVDSDRSSLDQQRKAFDQKFPQANIHYIEKDFRKPLYLPMLDGILMANSLHFAENQEEVLTHVLRYVRPNGRFILVEYNTDEGNQWVPYPISFNTFKKLAENSGLSPPQKIGSVPSRFLREMYCSVSIKS